MVLSNTLAITSARCFLLFECTCSIPESIASVCYGTRSIFEHDEFIIILQDAFKLSHSFVLTNDP